MDSVALTDHGNMFGVIDFYKRAKDAGVKPIFGCETYVAGDRPLRQDRAQELPPHPAGAGTRRATRTCRTSTRWATSRASTTTRASTSSCSRSTREGLIGLSACLGGEMAQTLDEERLREGQGGRARVRRRCSSRAASTSRCMPNGLARAGAGQRRAERRWRARPASRWSRPTTATTCNRKDDARRTTS